MYDTLVSSRSLSQGGDSGILIINMLLTRATSKAQFAPGLGGGGSEIKELKITLFYFGGGGGVEAAKENIALSPKKPLGSPVANW